MSDNHTSNVVSSREVSSEKKSKMFVNSQAVCMLYETVHIVKNLCNNRYVEKDYCTCHLSVIIRLFESITVAVGESSCSLLLRVHENMKKKQASMLSIICIQKLFIGQM